MLEAILSFFAAAALVAFYEDQSPGDPNIALGMAVLSFIVMRLVHARWTAMAIGVIKRMRPDSPPLKLRMWMFPVLHAAVLFALLEFGGWSAFVHAQPILMKSAVLRDFALLLPWFGYFASWQWARQALHVELRHRPWSKSAFLTFHFRALLIPATPFVLNDLFNDLMRFFPIAQSWFRYFPSLGLVASLVILAIVFAFSPFIIRMGLPMQSLSDGPLRRRFEATAQAANFRYLDILVCKTEGNIVNAAFLGVLGKMRYVVMTDGILASLREDDLVGVFAHEMGHSHRRHLILSNALIVGFLLMMHALSIGTSTVTPTGGFVFAGVVAAFVAFVFLPIARRFETEADVFAGEILRDPQPITRSLCALGDMFPHMRSRGGFLHPSIEARVAFLGEYFKNADLKAAFIREMRRVRKTIFFFLGAALLVWATQLPAEWHIGHWSMSVRNALLAKDGAEAERLLAKLESESRDGKILDGGFEMRMWLWQTIVAARQEKGDYTGAEPFLAEIRAHRSEFADPFQRYNAASLLAQQAAGQGDWTSLREHAPEAAELLKVIEPLTPPENAEAVQEMERENRDVKTFEAALWILEHIGELVPVGDRLPWPALPPGDGPDFVTQLKKSLDQGTPLDASLRADATRAGGDLHWRRDFLERLAQTVVRAMAAPRTPPGH